MNEVTKAPEQEVSTGEELTLEQMMGEYKKDNVTVSDIKIPKLLMMQATSQFVATEEIAMTGDLVNSVTAEIYASTKNKETVNVYPLLGWKTWQVQKLENGKWEYSRTEPASDKLERQFETQNMDGETEKNIFCQNYYVMLEKDLKDAAALPHVLTFRSSSFAEGQNISTLGATAKIPLFMHRFEIGGIKKTKDTNTWYLTTTKHVGNLSPAENQAEMNLLFGWWKTLKASDHSDVDHASDQESAGRKSKHGDWQAKGEASNEF